MRKVRPGDRWSVAAVVCLVAGGVLLLVAWYDVSGTNQLYEQLPYLVSAGFTGLALVMVGCALLIAGRYDRVERRLARLVDALTDPVLPDPVLPDPVLPDPVQPDPAVDDDRREPARSRTGPGASDGAMDDDARSDGWVVVANGTTFHRPSCPLVQGKRMSPVTVHAVADGGLHACPVCDPDTPSDLAGSAAPVDPERA